MENNGKVARCEKRASEVKAALSAREAHVPAVGKNRGRAKKRGKLDLPSGVIQQGLTIVGNRIFVVCEDGSVSCFGAK